MTAGGMMRGYRGRLGLALGLAGACVFALLAGAGAVRAQSVVASRPSDVIVDMSVLNRLGGEPTLPDLYLHRLPRAIYPIGPGGTADGGATLHRPTGGGSLAPRRAAPAAVKAAAPKPAALQPATTPPAQTASAAPASAAPAPAKTPAAAPAARPSRQGAPPAPGASPPGGSVPSAGDVRTDARVAVLLPAVPMPVAAPAPAPAPASAPVPAAAPARPASTLVTPEQAASAPTLVTPQQTASAPPALVASTPSAPASVAPASVAPASVAPPPAAIAPPLARAPQVVASTPAPQQQAALTSVAPPPSPPPSSGLGQMSLTFETGVPDPSQPEKDQLVALAKRMQADPKMRLTIRGYAAGTDQTRSDARILSLTRAVRVRNVLVDQGVNQYRINVKALGMEPEGGTPDRVDIDVQD